MNVAIRLAVTLLIGAFVVPRVLGVDFSPGYVAVLVLGFFAVELVYFMILNRGKRDQ